LPCFGGGPPCGGEIQGRRSGSAVRACAKCSTGPWGSRRSAARPTARFSAARSGRSAGP
jgi:hypothetical protein